MLYATRLSKLIGILFQTSAALFEPLLRYRFGRRSFLLGRSILLPFLLLVVALLVRGGVPQLAFLPLAFFLPPDRVTALLDAGVLDPVEQAAFVGFALLFLVAAFVQYIALWINRARKLDSPATRSWGRSWIGNLPGLSVLSQSAIQGKVEPALIIGAGYLLLDAVPVFGFFLMTGGFVYGWDSAYLWREFRARELDARDALAESEFHKAAHEGARAHFERARVRSRGRIASHTLARIQKTPHALLALSPEETVGALEALGETRFVELCKDLPSSAQREVLARVLES